MRRALGVGGGIAVLLVMVGLVATACDTSGGPRPSDVGRDLSAAFDVSDVLPPVDLSPDAPTDLAVDLAADAEEGRDVSDGTDSLAADIDPPPCQDDRDCAGRVPGLAPCERALCDARHGACVAGSRPDGDDCEDEDACTTDTVCQTGRCVGERLRCDDGEPCTADACDAALGCVHTPRAAACDDGDPCTEGDACESGRCRPGLPTCPCGAPADCAAWDDGDPCTGVLRCDDGHCRVDPASVVVCAPPGETPCRDERCEPASGTCVEHTLRDGTPCDDGDACTVGDACLGGTCRGGLALDCDDGNACTDDRCDPAAGCLFPPLQRACDDGDGCTEADWCAQGVCLPGNVNDCLDETCLPVGQLLCGARDTWFRDAPGTTDLLAGYPDCEVSGLSGPELTYAFVAPFDGEARLTLADAGEGVFALVLEGARRGCDARTCRRAAPPEVTFPMTAGQAYYVVVDGPSGAEMPFQVALDCTPLHERRCDDDLDDDGDGTTDCQDVDCVDDAACQPTTCAPLWTLRCDEPVAARTDGPGFTQLRGVYGCGAGLSVLTGPETSYAFTAPAAGRYTLELEDASASLELLVLDAGGDCRSGPCRVRGPGAVGFDAEAGAALEVVVDGEGEAGGSFRLVVRCPDDLERDCGDGVDDDGDGATDCVDADCAADPACGAGTCRPVAELACGDRMMARTAGPGHTATLADYGCSLFPYTGPELAYRLDVPPGAIATARLQAADADLDVLLLASDDPAACDSADCLVLGDSVAQGTAPEVGGLVAVVDGYDGATGAFALSLDCTWPFERDCADGTDDDGDALIDCRDDDCFGTPACPRCDAPAPVPIGCDETVAVSTLAPAATERLDAYGCNGNDYGGPERVFRFEPGLGGRITVTLDEETAPLDLIVLEGDGEGGCHPARCLGYSPYRVRWRAAGGQVYYIVVDGYGGATGSAALHVDCEDQ